MSTPVDQDDKATWRQLRDRLREIRTWVNETADRPQFDPGNLLAILDRPRNDT